MQRHSVVISKLRCCCCSLGLMPEDYSHVGEGFGRWDAADLSEVTKSPVLQRSLI